MLFFSPISGCGKGCGHKQGSCGIVVLCVKFSGHFVSLEHTFQKVLKKYHNSELGHCILCAIFFPLYACHSAEDSKEDVEGESKYTSMWFMIFEKKIA